MGVREISDTRSQARRAAESFLAQVHMNEFSRAGLIAAYRDERDANKIAAVEFDCMQKVITRDLDAVLGRLFAQKFSRYDIEKAAAFYRTPSGEKFARMMNWAIAEKVPSLGLKNEGEEPSLYIEELVELDNFRKSLKSREQVDPLQAAIDLLVAPEVTEFEREKRRECLKSAKG
jgi:uncharacterized iron-regulated protein